MKLIDIPALLQRVAAVTGVREDCMLQSGAWLPVRWWRLYVCVDRQFHYAGNDRWLPGVAIWGRDPEGRFGSNEFKLFDRVTDADVDVPRIDRYLDMFVEARRESQRKREARRRKKRGR